MPAFALNHMTVAAMGFQPMLDLAQRLGCVGVECRNDLDSDLFDGLSPQSAGEMLRDVGLRLLSLAEIKRFDRLTVDELPAAVELMDAAAEAGAEAVSLIPSNDGEPFDEAAMVVALELLMPHLQQRQLTGLIEPLGFETCGLRFKRLAVDLLESRGWTDQFKIIHDTFHHHVAGETEQFPSNTGLVHLSGVTDCQLALSQMRDPHRVLVGEDDRLGNVTQITELLNSGCSAPLSFEAFAPEIHGATNIEERLQRSMNHIDNLLSLEAA
ncbi:MAG: TIM barrel protein [Rhizobiaceae bacterium]